MSAQAAFAATLVDEWARAGVAEAVVAPGSRSTPLVLALAADARINVHVHVDERSASFYALGLALASGMPALVVTTSGTAAAELHPAVVEADHARVPLVVCTADRPPELHDVAAPQTIKQTGLFGGSVRWSAAPGPADVDAAPTWRSLAARAIAEALGSGGAPGPVHLNLAFREPFMGDPGELPPARPGGRPWHLASRARASDIDPGALDQLRALASRRRGVIVAGAGCGDPQAVLDVAAAGGWPVLADARSGCRLGAPPAVAAFDALLRDGDFTASHAPEVVIRLGVPPASRVLHEWLTVSGAEQVVVDQFGGWPDPDRRGSLVVLADPTAFCYAAAEELAPPPEPWAATWQAAESAAQEAIDGELGYHDEVTEPGVARVLTALPADTPLFVSSSMPIRDVEWYGDPASRVRVFSNRGANGIDGVVSSALGVAVASRSPTVALLGDLALIHDSNGLAGAADRTATLVLVVVDNRGGGIFSFLPQATALAPDVFERLFATPAGVDIEGLLTAYGVPVRLVERIGELAPAVEAGATRGGVSAVVVRTDRTANVAVHDAIHRAVRERVASALAG